MRTVRYYADRKLIRPTRRTPGGYRLFDEHTLRQLRLMQRLQRLGLPLREIRALVRAAEPIGSIRLRRAQLRDLLAVVESRRAELEGTRHEFTRLTSRGEPSCADALCVCHIAVGRRAVE